MNGDIFPNAVIVLGTVLGGGACWCALAAFFSLFGGWSTLAIEFRSSTSATGNRFRFASGAVRKGRLRGTGYFQSLIVTVNDAGIYLAVWPFPRFVSPPLFLPWSRVASVTERGTTSAHVAVIELLGQWPEIQMRGEAGRHILDAFQRSRIGSASGLPMHGKLELPSYFRFRRRHGFLGHVIELGVSFCQIWYVTWLPIFLADAFGSAYLHFALLIPFISAPFAFLLFWLIDDLARRLRQYGAREMLSLDCRSPIIFLRAFGDDVAGIPMTPFKYEELIGDALAGAGPMVAVGKPSEKLPEVGIPRLYLSDDDWQRGVRFLIENSSGVVIQLGTT